jgi:hypothetical protein
MPGLEQHGWPALRLKPPPAPAPMPALLRQQKALEATWQAWHTSFISQCDWLPHKQ